MPLNVPEYKRILYIDLETQEAQYKNNADLWHYLGGVGVGYKLLLENIDSVPLVLTCGPLSGLFPYASKAGLAYISNRKVIEKYGGGSIAARLNMSGIDAVVFTNGANNDKILNIDIGEEEVVITESAESRFVEAQYDLVISGNSVNSLGYFSFGDFSKDVHSIGGLIGIKVNSSISIDIENYYDYEKIYTEMLEDYRSVSVEPRNNPSCLGCPLGCDYSSEGEDNENSGILPSCLISCVYSSEIYKDIPTVYACLNSIGYNYYHSDLINLSALVSEARLELIEKINTLEP